MCAFSLPSKSWKHCVSISKTVGFCLHLKSQLKKVRKEMKHDIFPWPSPLVLFSHFALCWSCVEPEFTFGFCQGRRLRCHHEAVRRNCASLEDFLNAKHPSLSSYCLLLPFPPLKNLWLQNYLGFYFVSLQRKNERSRVGL